LYAAHLQKALLVRNTETAESFTTAITKVVNWCLAGKTPRELSIYLAGAPIIPLAKKDNGIRPIAIGETLRRLVSKVCVFATKSEMSEFFSPIQVGINVKCGAEGIIHSISRMIGVHGRDDKLAMLKIDFKNAFNSVSREAMFLLCKEHFPKLYSWIIYCYRDQPLLWFDRKSIKSCVGVQQGDPLGPFLFCLVL
jgi:hypothetical protein